MNTNDHVTEEPPPTNRLAAAAQEVETEIVPEFNDLAIEPPKPPVRVKLEPPVDYDGKSYKEIVCDFGALTGADFRRCEREFSRLYKPDRNEMPLPEMKPDYHISLIVAAAELAGCHVPRGLILKLPGRYYTPLRIEALKACGSSSEEEKA